MTSSFGPNLGLFLETNGISQIEIASYVDKKKSTISKWISQDIPTYDVELVYSRIKIGMRESHPEIKMPTLDFFLLNTTEFGLQLGLTIRQIESLTRVTEASRILKNDRELISALSGVWHVTMFSLLYENFICQSALSIFPRQDGYEFEEIYKENNDPSLSYLRYYGLVRTFGENIFLTGRELTKSWDYEIAVLPIPTNPIERETSGMKGWILGKDNNNRITASPLLVKRVAPRGGKIEEHLPGCTYIRYDDEKIRAEIDDLVTLLKTVPPWSFPAAQSIMRKVIAEPAAGT
jgi:hypothetical protein